LILNFFYAYKLPPPQRQRSEFCDFLSARILGFFASLSFKPVIPHPSIPLEFNPFGSLPIPALKIILVSAEKNDFFCFLIGFPKTRTSSSAAQPNDR